MVKTYVIDSSVLLYSPESILSFGENFVVVPQVVIEEIKSYIWEKGDLGNSARKAQVIINHLIAKRKYGKWVPLLNGGIFKVELNRSNQKLPLHWNPEEFDNRLFQVCLGLQEDSNKVILVTRDVLTRIKADILGIRTQDFEHDSSSELHGQYQPGNEVFVSPAEVDDFLKKGYLNPERVKTYTDQLLLTPRRWQVKLRNDNEQVQKLG